MAVGGLWRLVIVLAQLGRLSGVAFFITLGFTTRMSLYSELSWLAVHRSASLVAALRDARWLTARVRV